MLTYCSRGKKVFRRFDGEDDEEEEDIEGEDIELLSQAAVDGRRQRSLKTLTRKSIKPTRLFQTEEQKAAREREKEEEAATDVEDHSTSTLPIAEPSTSEIKARTSDKKTSPFDQWGRAKKTEDGPTLRPGKRTATDAFDRGSPGVETRVSNKRKTRA